VELPAALFQTDRDGAVVGFPYYAQFEDGPVAVGAGRLSGQAVLAAPFAGASGLGFCCLKPVGVRGNGVRD
jgi:hypothetical protein